MFKTPLHVSQDVEVWRRDDVLGCCENFRQAGDPWSAVVIHVYTLPQMPNRKCFLSKHHLKKIKWKLIQDAMDVDMPEDKPMELDMDLGSWNMLVQGSGRAIPEGNRPQNQLHVRLRPGWLASRTSPALPDHEEAQEYLQKSGWPEIERDSAPSSTIPHAQKCIQKHLKKLEALKERFDVPKLTALQEKCLG